MLFSEVFDALATGKLIRRVGWRERGDNVALKRYGDEIKVVDLNTDTLCPRDGSWIWHYTICDDWEVVENDFHGTDFYHAMKMVQEDRGVRRHSWLKQKYIRKKDLNAPRSLIEKIVFDTNSCTGSPISRDLYMPTIGDIVANDWYDATSEMHPFTEVNVANNIADNAEVESTHDKKEAVSKSELDRLMEEHAQQVELVAFYRSIVEDVKCIRTANFDLHYLYNKIKERFKEFDTEAGGFFLELKLGTGTEKSDNAFLEYQRNMFRSITDLAVYAICFAVRKFNKP